jgi:hypothetical protein
MQPQLSANQVPADPVMTLLLRWPLDVPPNECQIAKQHEVWLEDQHHPIEEREPNGVPWSALSD